MVKAAHFIYLVFLLALLVGCGVDTFQCDDCEDPFTPDNCVDLHSQYHEGVVYDQSSGDIEYFDLADINPFNDAFIQSVRLFDLGNSKVLVTSDAGNYVVDIISNESHRKELSVIPAIGYKGADNLIISTPEVGDIIINDSTIIKKFISKTT